MRDNKKQQAIRFSDAIRKQITSSKPITPTDSLALAIMLIMKEFPGYRLEHFFGEKPISSAQFFGMIDLIREKATEEEKRMKEMENKSKRR